MTKRIISKDEYNKMMPHLNLLMQKDESQLSDSELEEIRTLALSAQEYEKSIYQVEAPATIEGMVELKMYEMKLKQKDLASMLSMSDTKLSMILSGKQKPDIAFIKGIYDKLHVPADFILEHI